MHQVALALSQPQSPRLAALKLMERPEVDKGSDGRDRVLWARTPAPSFHPTPTSQTTDTDRGDPGRGASPVASLYIGTCHNA